jgi:hypothetical protein
MRIVAFIVTLTVAASGQIQPPPPFPPVKVPSARTERHDASIAGRIMSQEKKPIKDARVSLQKGSRTGPISIGNHDPRVPTMVTTEDGTFVFEGIAPGTYAVMVERPPYYENFEVVEVRAGRHVKDVTIVLRHDDPNLHPPKVPPGPSRR